MDIFRYPSSSRLCYLVACTRRVCFVMPRLRAFAILLMSRVCGRVCEKGSRDIPPFILISSAVENKRFCGFLEKRYGRTDRPTYREYTRSLDRSVLLRTFIAAKILNREKYGFLQHIQHELRFSPSKFHDIAANS